MNDYILRLLQRYLYAEIHLSQVPTVEMFRLRKELWELVKDKETTEERHAI